MSYEYEHHRICTLSLSDGPIKTPADIYAFGMCALEVSSSSTMSTAITSTIFL